MSKIKFFLFPILIVSCCFFSCQNNTKNWNKISKSIEQWSSYNLQIKGIKAAFPKIPVSRTIAYSKDINFYENYAETDTVTFSVAMITNAKLKSLEEWTNFLNNEVLAMEALERKNIKIYGRNAVISKVRVSDLCSYTINMIVDNSFIVNIGIRYKGAFPPEKLIMEYASKVIIRH